MIYLNDRQAEAALKSKNKLTYLFMEIVSFNVPYSRKVVYLFSMIQIILQFR